MRIAVFSDIHGNLVALEAALTAIQGDRPDGMLCLGDVTVFGPQPQKTVECLQTLDCSFVMGNTDAFALDPAPLEKRDEDSQRIEAIETWCAEQLTDESKTFLRSFQPTITLGLAPGKALLGYHGSPRSFHDPVESITSDEQMTTFFGSRHTAVMAGGHTHTVMLRHYRGALVINPGSVGVPYAYDSSGQAYNPAYAEYALVDDRAGQINITFRRVPYDLARLRQTIFASGMPHADWYARDWRSA